jgi:hypothetical protein
LTPLRQRENSSQKSNNMYICHCQNLCEFFVSIHIFVLYRNATTENVLEKVLQKDWRVAAEGHLEDMIHFLNIKKLVSFSVLDPAAVGLMPPFDAGHGSLCLRIHLPACTYLCLYLYICLFIHLSVYMYACIYVCVCVCMFICPYLHMYVCLYIFVSNICLL